MFQRVKLINEFSIKVQWRGNYKKKFDVLDRLCVNLMTRFSCSTASHYTMEESVICEKKVTILDRPSYSFTLAPADHIVSKSENTFEGSCFSFDFGNLVSRDGTCNTIAKEDF